MCLLFIHFGYSFVLLITCNFLGNQCSLVPHYNPTVPLFPKSYFYSISSRLYISTPATVAEPTNSFSCLVIDAFNLRFPAFKFSTYIKEFPTESSSLSNMFTLAFHSKSTKISSHKFLSLYQKRTINNKRCPTRHKPDPKMTCNSFFLQNSIFYPTFCFKIRLEGPN